MQPSSSLIVSIPYRTNIILFHQSFLKWLHVPRIPINTDRNFLFRYTPICFGKVLATCRSKTIRSWIIPISIVCSRVVNSLSHMTAILYVLVSTLLAWRPWIRFVFKQILPRQVPIITGVRILNYRSSGPCLIILFLAKGLI